MIRYGPPIPGAPWLRSKKLGTGFVIPALADSTLASNRAGPLLAPDPEADVRTRRQTQMLSQIVNSLYGQGYLVRTGISTWVLRLPAYTVARAPTVHDDTTRGHRAHDQWIDSVTNDVYILVDATTGNAVWKKVT